MYLWTILLAILFATPALAQEGIWEDSLPLDGVGGGDTDTGPVPDCTGTTALQDADGTCITALTDGVSDADSLHTHGGIFDPATTHDITWGDGTEADLLWDFSVSGPGDAPQMTFERGAISITGTPGAGIDFTVDGSGAQERNNTVSEFHLRF
jgi:hypothetical protein